MLSLLALFFNKRFEVELANTGMKIHVVGTYNRGAVPKLVRNVKGQCDREGKIDLKEVLQAFFGRHGCVAERHNGNVELGNENDDIEREADPRTDDTRLRSEGQLIERMTLKLPTFTEADMGKADGRPCEDSRERRKRK